MATLVELYLKITTPRYTDEEVYDNLNKLLKLDEKKYQLPKILCLRKEVEEIKYKNMQVFVFNKKIVSDKVIIYLHGGAYIRQPRFHHIKFIKKLAKKTKLPIYVPIYPKLPCHTVDEAYQLMTEFYLGIKKKYQDIYLMGDSSGGGLALGLCEDFIINKIEQPKELILFSPWVDISLNNSEIKKYERIDPLLSVSNTKIWGNMWSKDYHKDSYKVSPLYGNVKGLSSVKLFIGTREILYPDNKLLYELLIKNDINVIYYEGIGLNHVYPIYPIPEAKKALKELIKIILK